MPPMPPISQSQETQKGGERLVLVPMESRIINFEGLCMLGISHSCQGFVFRSYPTPPHCRLI